METKSEKFARIANRRVSETLDCFRLLTNLTSGSYASSQEQRSALLDSLRRGLNALEDAWTANLKPDKSAFTLEETKED